MSDPVIKGAKRASSRPAPQSASPKSSARSSKLTAKPAKPKPKRAAADKAPARKASPVKSSSAKTSRPAAKQAKRSEPPKAAKKAAAKERAASASKAPAAKKPPTKTAAKPKPKPVAPAKKSTRTAAPARPVAAAKPAPAPQKQPSRDEAAALKAFERAHKEFVRGNFTAARDAFRALIEQHSGVSEVTARARTYLAVTEARLRTEASIPRDPDSLYDRGVIELNRGDFVAAQEMFERALKRDPRAADTHYALAATRARLGAVEPALESLERAIELKSVLRVRAQSDADFTILRNEPEFERIVYPSSRA